MSEKGTINNPHYVKTFSVNAYWVLIQLNNEELHSYPVNRIDSLHFQPADTTPGHSPRGARLYIHVAHHVYDTLGEASTLLELKARIELVTSRPTSTIGGHAG